MRELRRVMRPGGHLLIHTPNRWHYVALFATLTPTSFHAWFNSKPAHQRRHVSDSVSSQRQKRALERLASGSGFRVVRLDLLETKPDYLYFHPLAYRAGIVYERIVNRWPGLARFRVQIIADLEAI